jgi:hypothetical protein
VDAPLRSAPGGRISDVSSGDAFTRFKCLDQELDAAIPDVRETGQQQWDFPSKLLRLGHLLDLSFLMEAESETRPGA